MSGIFKQQPVSIAETIYPRNAGLNLPPSSLGGVQVGETGRLPAPPPEIKETEFTPSKPNSLLSTLAVVAALGGRGQLLSLFQQRQEAEVGQKQRGAEVRTLQSRLDYEHAAEQEKAALARQKLNEPEYKVDDKGNITIINPAKLRTVLNKPSPTAADLKSAVFTLSTKKTLTEEQFPERLAELEKLFDVKLDGDTRAQLYVAWKDSVESQDETPFRTTFNQAIARQQASAERKEARTESQEFRREMAGEARETRFAVAQMVQDAINERRKLDPSMYQLVSEQVEAGQMSLAQVPDVNDRAKIQQLIKDRGGVIMTPQIREKIQKVVQVRGIAAEAERISDKVNTAGGGVAPVVGGLRKLGEKAGLDPDVTRLETLRSELGPLARTVSSEVGVLTNPDIDRAQVLIPTVYDSKERAKAKLEMLNRFIDLMERSIRLTAGATLADTEAINREMTNWRKDSEQVIKEGKPAAKERIDPKTGKVVRK